MASTSAENILEQLNWRYAVKAFDATKKLSDKDWQTLSESLRLTPSSYGLQPFKFIVVKNAELKKKLRAVSYNQSQIEDCSHLVVLTTLKKVSEKHVKDYIRLIAETRAMPVEPLAGLEQMMMGSLVANGQGDKMQPWTQRQAYIAMGFLLETAALIGVDACPIEGIEPMKYDEVLGLNSSEFATVAVVALGYRSATDIYQKMKKVRQPTSTLIEIR
ncbi:MAG: NAD(P)H-dependent oxidoreductase [Bdellovibrionota bacterium]